MPSVFITGADTGLGKAFAEELASREWSVFAGTRKPIETLPSIPHVTWISLELTDDTAIIAAATRVRAAVGTLDVLINNAGVNKDSATGGHKEKATVLEHLDRTTLLHMYDVNAVAPMMMTKAFLELLSGHPSFIIYVSSCRASYHDAMPQSSANYGYNASKAALNMLVHCSVRDLPKEVRTFAVHPGDMKTGMNPDGEQDPRSQAKEILSILDHWVDTQNGTFLNYDGTVYPS